MNNKTPSMKKLIPIIDIFAGPGGLGEGFMSLKDDDGQPVFDIRLSIEKDKDACKTLTWRSFYRQFKKNGRVIPDVYYDALKESDIDAREKMIEKALDTYPEGQIAKEEVRQIELGSQDWPADYVDELIQKQLGGETNWVLIGGPPCQAYSNAGRSRVGGINPEDHRVYLYREYLRIIDEHRPAVFVMENVKGLLSAKVGQERVFDWIKEDLKLDNDYEIHSLVRPAEDDDRNYLIKSENYGVPQMRHRVILLGIRKNYSHNESFYLKESIPVTLSSVIGQLPKIRSGLNREFVDYDKTKLSASGKPKRIYRNLKDSDEKWSQYVKGYRRQIEQWGGLSTSSLDGKSFLFPEQTGSEFVVATKVLDKSVIPKRLYDWFSDEKLGGVPNHQARAHLTQDLIRYLFAALYVKQHNRFPRLQDYAEHSNELLPDHANVNSGKFSDRFRVQVPDRPATTVTSHISKDGHYFIHYDPEQCRSLTVREAARIQTFPDNYLFRGPRTSQYQQVGNAVPPYLANQIAKIVKNLIKENT